MPQNTTDHIAKLAWNTTHERWREFMVLPTVASLVSFGAVGLLFYMSRSQGFDFIGVGVGLIYLLYIIFAITFYTALAKWCSDLYAGKKVIDIEEGLRYGLSRFWGVVGTSFLTFFKILLWSLLLILPGIYKGLMYFHSIQVSQLEKISGGDANRISQKMISQSGILRTLGNFMAVYFVTIIAFYIYSLLAFLLAAVFARTGSEILASIISGSLMTLGMVVLTTFMVVFINMQYLIYRDENKAALATLTKTLKGMK